MPKHKPVLVEEAIEGLAIGAGDTILDGTIGSAGHSAAIAEKFKDSVTIIGLDRDPEAIKRSEDRLRAVGANFKLVNESFRNIDTVLAGLNIDKVDGILLDIGISSDQLEASDRGFSFQTDAPLDMRMGPTGPTAAEILNGFTEEALELILRGFGEERYSRQIAREIVATRETKPFETTQELVQAVERVRPKRWYDKIHPATQTFQALRIATNDELTALEEGMEKGFKALSEEGRFAIISFHSLEDRLVKNFFRDRAASGEAELITRKPVVPTDEEMGQNPRSRSAKLRILKKI